MHLVLKHLGSLKDQRLESMPSSQCNIVLTFTHNDVVDHIFVNIHFIHNQQFTILTISVVIGSCFTQPADRRRGAGAKMLKWGLDKADELGCESFVEASEIGQPFYESFGYICSGETFIPRKPGEESNAEWKALEEKWQLWFRWMWRPAKGSNWTEGMPFPWQTSVGDS